MALPEELKQPIDEIKQPGTRGWIVSLISAITFIVPLGIVQIKNRDAEIKRLNERAAQKDAEENARLTKRTEFLDSMIYILKNKQ